MSIPASRCLVLATLLVALPVAAEQSWQARVGVASNAFYRGFELSRGGDPLYQVLVEWQNSTGVYAGAWLSRLDLNDDREREVDYYVGYQRRWNDLIATDVTLQRYTYDADVFGRDYDWNELQAAVHVGRRWTFLAASGDNWTGRDTSTHVLEVTYRHPLAAYVTGHLTVGRHLTDGTLPEDFAYVDAGLSRALGAGFEVAVRYADSIGEGDFGRPVDGEWALSLAWVHGG